MKRNHMWGVLSILVLMCSTAAFAKSNVPTANTHAAIKAYVQSAAKVIAKSGPSCDTFKGTDWMAGDYYIFVIDSDNKLICHPNPDMVGKSNNDIVDANGKKIGTELKAAGEKKGGGWVDYIWPRPGQTTPTPKSSYAMRVKGKDGKWYVVGAGGYELK